MSPKRALLDDLSTGFIFSFSFILIEARSYPGPLLRDYSLFWKCYFQWGTGGVDSAFLSCFYYNRSALADSFDACIGSGLDGIK